MSIHSSTIFRDSEKGGSRFSESWHVPHNLGQAHRTLSISFYEELKCVTLEVAGAADGGNAIRGCFLLCQCRMGISHGFSSNLKVNALASRS